jgi:hypothetical protein
MFDQQFVSITILSHATGNNTGENTVFSGIKKATVPRFLVLLQASRGTVNIVC